MTVPPTDFSDALYHLRQGGGIKSSFRAPPADVRIVTSCGSSIPAHSSILASASLVLENMLYKPRRNQSSEKIIRILGVPSGVVVAFLRFLYSSKCTDEEIEKYGIQLLALSHVYSIRPLKQKCLGGLAEALTADNVIDVLKLAKLFDAPALYIKGMKLVCKEFKRVEQTEGWKFLHDHDPWLELDVLQFLDETQSRQKRRKVKQKEQKLYLELSEAMECLEHICTEGCTSVGPYDMEPPRKREPCNKFSTCQGLQVLIRHFAKCTKRVNGGCSLCKRMWQLLKLHSSMCDRVENCKVPLCRQFKLKIRVEDKGVSSVMWRLLVRKVKTAKVMSSFSFANRSTRINKRL